MKFMVLIYGSDEAWDQLGPADNQKLADAHGGVHADLAGTGELLAASELETDGAKVIRSRGGTIETTDGAFTDGREVLSGYYILDCVDMDRAVAIASRFAEAEFAPIEVRRLGVGSTWVDALTDKAR